MTRYIKILIAVLCIVNTSFAQSSNQYTNDIYQKVSDLDGAMHQRFKDTLILRRVETGILDVYSDALAADCERKLFSGQTYLVVAFTDKRVPDMKLICYKKNSTTNKWEEVKTIDEYKSSQEAYIGDKEIYSVDIQEDASYKFKILAPKNANTARYGMMVWSKKKASPTTTTGARSWSIDNYSVSEYKNGAYGDFPTGTTYNCLFQINAAESVITLKDDDGISKFYIDSKNTDDATWIVYFITSTKGVKYKFKIPTDDAAYIRIIKIDSSVPYPSLTDYHIKSKWTD